MKWIKSLLYNTCIDYVILFCAFIIVLVFNLFIKNEYIVLYVGLLVIILMSFLLKKNKNEYKNLRYLTCSHSFIWRKYVWINQYVSIRRDKSKCPQKEFVNEMIDIRKVLPKGTVCYCCTHELIKKHIKKIYPNAEYTEVYKKDLKRLKKKLKSAQCKQCTARNCSLFKSEEVQFYAVKFTIE